MYKMIQCSVEKYDFLQNATHLAHICAVYGEYEICNYILKLSFVDVCKFSNPPKVEATSEDNFSFREKIFESVHLSTDRLQPWEYISWPNTYGPILWKWLHIVTFYIDINAGFIDTESFMTMIRFMIFCEMCDNHYMGWLPIIKHNLFSNSVSDTFFILHTLIQKKTKRHEFINYDRKDVNLLINQKHKTYFLQQFFKIMLDEN